MKRRVLSSPVFDFDAMQSVINQGLDLAGSPTQKRDRVIQTYNDAPKRCDVTPSRPLMALLLGIGVQLFFEFWLLT